MLGKPDKLRIRTGVSKDLGISRGNHAPALALESPAHDRRATAPDTGVDDLVDEVNEVVREAHSYLLAHPNMVADCYRSMRRLYWQRPYVNRDGWGGRPRLGMGCAR